MKHLISDYFLSEDGVHGMNNTIGSFLVEEDNVGAASTGLQLDELVSGDADFLASSSVDGGGAGGEVLAGHHSPGDHVPHQH